MLRRGEVLKTRRFYVWSIASILVSTLLAITGMVPVALCLSIYFLVYLAVSYTHLKYVTNSAKCQVGGIELELRSDDAELVTHLVISSKTAPAVYKLYLGLPSQLSLSGRYSMFSLKFPPGVGEVKVRIPILRRAGLHTLGPLTVAASDLLGVYEVPVYYRESVTVKIPPRVGTTPIARWYGIVRSSSGARTLSPGLGVEYHSTREYRPEDEPRHIDWKATARLGKLHVKVFEVETPLKVAVVLDANKYMFIGSPRSLLEYSAELVVALSSYLLKRGDRITLVVISEDGIKRSSEIRNYSNLVEVLEVLSNIRWPVYAPTPRLEISPIGSGLDSLRDSFRDISAIVIFSPVLSDHRVIEILELSEQMRKSGVKVMVVAPLITFFSAASRLDGTIYRVLRFNIVSREFKNMKLLENSGVQVVFLSPHKALEKVVAELERIRVIRSK